jgi:hypothetical protein
MGEWICISTVRDVCAVWRRVLSSMLRPLYPWGRSHCCSLGRRLSGPRNLSGFYGEKKYCPCRELNPYRSARRPCSYHSSCNTRAITRLGMRVDDKETQNLSEPQNMHMRHNSIYFDNLFYIILCRGPLSLVSTTTLEKK